MATTRREEAHRELICNNRPAVAHAFRISRPLARTALWSVMIFWASFAGGIMDFGFIVVPVPQVIVISSPFASFCCSLLAFFAFLAASAAVLAVVMPSPALASWFFPPHQFPHGLHAHSSIQAGFFILPDSTSL